jgi:hypothetical protein
LTVFRGLALGLGATALALGHEPITTKLTWTREISRIVYQRCIGCHRPGGRAPMSLISYEQVRPWAKAIRDEVLERRMPPWGAMKGFGAFRGDTSLSEREIEMLANWVEGGAPEGNPLFQPPLPPPPPEGIPPPSGAGLDLPAALDRDVTAVAVEPAQAGPILARRPDGSYVPLIWLLRQRPEQPKIYRFDQPLRLPRGTVIEGAGRLIISAGKPAR